MYSLDEVKKVDPEVAQAIIDEENRQNSHIELIASENWVSKAVMAAMGSSLTPVVSRLRKDIPARDITVVVSAWMSSRIWRSNVPRSCLDVIMPMYSPIPEHRQIWQCSSLC